MRQPALSAIALAVALAASGAMIAATPALAGLTKMRAGVKMELSTFAPGLDVDVDSLSDAQVAQINHLLFSDRSVGDIQGLIRSTVGKCVPILCRFTTRN